jgi:hypothetical protein
MWTFWASFVVFLADPPWAREWGLPTVDGGGIAPALQHPVLAALADLALIAVFGLQHSVMARPWFKAAVLSRVPQAFERCTFVHAANMALIALILLWQPIPIELWHASPPMRAVLWIAFAVGWVIARSASLPCVLLGSELPPSAHTIRSIIDLRAPRAHGTSAPER